MQKAIDRKAEKQLLTVLSRVVAARTNPAVGRPVPAQRKKKKPGAQPGRGLDLYRLLYEDPQDPYGGDRLKLPNGETVRLPDRAHPGCAALRRIKAGEEQPGDQELYQEWYRTIDPRYLAYMAALGKMPTRSEQMIKGPSRTVQDGEMPGADVVIGQFAALIEDEVMEACPHVRQKAPESAYWLGWAPRKLRCYECAQEEHRRIKGGREDFTCDACGHIDRKHIQTVSKLTLPITYRQLMVSVFLMFGLCRRCMGEQVIPIKQQKEERKAPVAVTKLRASRTPSNF
jgi:hypothetical protein